MKERLVLSAFIISFLFITPQLSIAQSSRNETRLRNLQKSIDRIETRIADAEQRMITGDSLIIHGDQQISIADKDFFRIADEVKRMNRKYRTKKKKFYKLTKSNNREISIQARNDIRLLDSDRRLSLRTFSFEVRDMKKRAMKGDSDIRKGQQMQASSAKSLRASQKSLRAARERYELALSPLGH